MRPDVSSVRALPAVNGVTPAVVRLALRLPLVLPIIGGLDRPIRTG